MSPKTETESARQAERVRQLYAGLRENDLRNLAIEACDALGCNSTKSAEEIMEHAIAQAALELGVVEHALEANQDRQEFLRLMYLVQGIRGRLQLAAGSARTLDSLLNEREASS